MPFCVFFSLSLEKPLGFLLWPSEGGIPLLWKAAPLIGLPSEADANFPEGMIVSLSGGQQLSKFTTFLSRCQPLLYLGGQGTWKIFWRL
ncbi:hypothetical protein Nepgr_006391 [Nepenthes gracilis]|uniref:Uncharacterized protein n=1 Tax=Nepenthes gracilis TaxID=150966 RepID=A0AAD3S5B7_NEPGR|nr:hypothetical protein Nepgr_006391 [Nepenthes gracilis]